MDFGRNPCFYKTTDSQGLAIEYGSRLKLNQNQVMRNKCVIKKTQSMRDSEK